MKEMKMTPAMKAKKKKMMAEDGENHAAGRARMAEMQETMGKPKTVLHSAYRGRK